MRYYGNKAGLFAAAVAIDPGLPGLPIEPREAIGRTLVRHFLTLWEGNGELTALMRGGRHRPGRRRSHAERAARAIGVVRPVPN
ncbi:hypothetical protein ACZ90_39985 [Streptomyces albus subsp. albus]|nr:hypothetical protein ACZ90_39985 [Streptomyces albus subsp. albus]